MRRENCPICCGDSFECGGGVSGVCIGSDGGPYCCLTDKDGSACGEAHPCRIHRPQPAPSAEPGRLFDALRRASSPAVPDWAINEMAHELSRAGLALVPANQPCSGCAAAMELLVLWYHNRAETESGELIEVATQNWLKEHGE